MKLDNKTPRFFLVSPAQETALVIEIAPPNFQPLTCAKLSDAVTLSYVITAPVIVKVTDTDNSEQLPVEFMPAPKTRRMRLIEAIKASDYSESAEREALEFIDAQTRIFRRALILRNRRITLESTGNDNTLLLKTKKRLLSVNQLMLRNKDFITSLFMGDLIGLSEYIDAQGDYKAIFY